MEVIPYGKQSITIEDIKAVVEALESDYLTQGPRVKEFEEAFADYVGAKYAVAVSNGTAALHLCNLTLNVKKGDKIITSPITFAASANCVRYCEGEIIFSDIDPKTYLLDIENVEFLLRSSPKGTYKGLITVDFAGQAINLEAFRKLANEYGLWILEDACHAPGGYFMNNKGMPQSCGNGHYADLAIFSFHPVKHIATGEGGMITTNNTEYYEKLLKLRSHGITKKEDEFVNTIEFAVGQSSLNEPMPKEYPKWYMEMQDLGYNYRITDFQCALGISQLTRAVEGVKKRRELAETYYNAFHDKFFLLGQSKIIQGHAYHLYVIEVMDRLGLYNFLVKKNIYVQIHYIPCHLMPYYRERGWKEGDMPNAETYYKSCISLPMYPSLRKEQQDFVIEKIYEYYKNCELN